MQIIRVLPAVKLSHTWDTLGSFSVWRIWIHSAAAAVLDKADTSKL